MKRWLKKVINFMSLSSNIMKLKMVDGDEQTDHFQILQATHKRR